MSITANTIAGLLETGADAAPAIGAPDRPSLTYAGLRALVRRTGDWLNHHGIGRAGRVAIVLPNGPEMATCFVAVAAFAAAAPLNPASKAPEFAFDFEDLRIGLLIVAAGADGPAVTVAGAQGIPVVDLLPGEAAGDFELRARAPFEAEADEGGPGGADDVALLLHTSGTTAKPKIVPLSEANICRSAVAIAETLALTPADRGLAIMPLFHIHGLMAGILAPLAAGSFVFCTPGFDALRFFHWMGECRPSWYTAVPTMHQTILLRAPRNGAAIAANPLRFIRSSSASMPPQVIAELEQVFKAPLIESYGMSEAAHQMASNPLPPRARKIGSAGLPAGPEIAVMDEEGRHLPAGVQGELVIRGASVMRGYERNEAANEAAFVDGWFRTGDLGVIDEAGYVTLTGRLKEVIIRGGENVAPREVDEVIMDHPAVAQVVCFGVPHPKLGEEVAAAIVLRAGAAATEKEIQGFCAERLAAFKVPRTVLFLAEIPKGPTGKLQRIGLAARLGLSG